MELQAYFIRLEAYNYWANQTTVRLLKEGNREDEKLLAWMSHLLTAEQVWYRRIVDQSLEGLQIWNTRPLGGLQQELEENHTALASLVAETQDFDRVVGYANSRGDEFQTPLWEILGHLFNHGTHHRGQIAARIRELGGDPVPLDYIFYCRQNPY
ncbi:MAG TPA: hypothetical protein DCE41_09150 [Cytophagales bacterium]|nr:hypothetical protein [Cytophagales bacterium]HAA20357.1 hypothetical protein [Cytophagales bacterium]HAP62461.1 hypothetical protein [Cytophagales bacterium]